MSQAITSPEQIREYRKSLSERMRTLRESLNCTQDEMAKALGVNRGYVGMIEMAYPRLDIERVSALIDRAYTEFGATHNAAASTTPPAEVDAGATENPRLTRQEVSRRVNEFQQEFNLSPRALRTLFGLSAAHEYVIRTGRDGSGLTTRRKVIDILDRETKKLREAATSRPAPSAAHRNSEPPRQTRTDAVLPAVLVRDAKGLVAALSLDYKTKHRFQALPDGSYLVVKEV